MADKPALMSVAESPTAAASDDEDFVSEAKLTRSSRSIRKAGFCCRALL